MKSLKASIYFQLLLLILVTSIITGVISAVSEIKEIDSSLNKSCEEISKRTANSLAFPFWNLDSVGVSEILHAQIQNLNMLAIAIKEEDGGNHNFVQGVLKKEGEVLYQPINETDKSKFVFTSPILFENEKLGEVSVYLSGKQLKTNLIKTELFRSLTELVILLLLALPLSFIIVHSFIRPVEKLADSFSEVVKNNFETQVPLTKENEIRNIAVIFENVRLTILKSFAKLKKNEKDVSTILNSLADGVISIDHNNLVKRLNPVAEKLTGWSQYDALNNPLEQVLNIKSVKNSDKSTNFMSDILESLDSSETVRVELVDKIDEITYNVDIRLSHLVGENENYSGVVLIIHDVTEQIKFQEELTQTRKLESLGQLSGGVAHDFNNMLGGIIGFSELLNSSAEPGGEVEEYTQHILDAANSAADLTSKLLAFSRKGKVVSTPFSVHKSCSTAISILSRTINKNITISENYLAENQFISGDPSQIQSTILNLCINAKDAMPNGGELQIKSESLDIFDDNEYLLPSGDYIKLSISDTGTGISKEVQKRIFEPFFTTKSLGKGTGLGLAAVYGSVKNHNGSITVDSKINSGTTFSVLLPTVKTNEPVKIKTEDAPTDVLNKKVLIIDDEKIIRLMLDKVISNMGGEVTLAADGVEAVALFREKHSDIDIVIMDMVMPNMGGDICFYKLKEIDPNVPIILASGFDKNSAISDLLADGAVAYLHKPFDIQKLSQELYAHTR
jgi:PAS domain S-box-containing protein